MRRPTGRARSTRLLGATAAVILGAGVWAPTGLAVDGVGAVPSTSDASDTAGALATETTDAATATVSGVSDDATSAGDAPAPGAAASVEAVEESAAATTETVDKIAAPGAETVEKATTTPPSRTVEEVAAAPVQVVTDTVSGTTVRETATSLADAAENALATVSDAASSAPIVGAAAAPVHDAADETLAPVLEKVGPSAAAAETIPGSALAGLTGTPDAPRDASPAGSGVSGEAQARPAEAFTTAASVPSAPRVVSPRRSPARADRADATSVPRLDAPVSGDVHRSSVEASARAAPDPLRGDAGLQAAVGAAPSASGAGSIPILLAALAAALLLVAPGLSRRLRLGLAPWPRPILQLSLERPG